MREAACLLTADWVAKFTTGGLDSAKLSLRVRAFTKAGT